MRPSSLLVVPVAAVAVVALAFSDPVPAPAPEPPTTGLVTMYLRDPISSSVDFSRGVAGRTFENHMLKNFQSDLDAGVSPGEFYAGLDGDRVAAIVDLGTPQDLQQKYGYTETRAIGQGFASIRMHEGELVILKDYEAQTTQQLSDVDPLFEALAGKAHLPIEDDHLYIMRVRDKDPAGFDLMVKFIVVGYEPNVSVTLRWQRIDLKDAKDATDAK